MLSNFTKRILLFKVLGPLALMFFCAQNSYSQLVPISFEQRIENATTILEGQVVSQVSYWDENKIHIYTSNVIEVYKIFKGQINTNRVEIITMGGRVDDRIERVSNMLQLKIGDLGIFTAIPNMTKLTTTANLTKFKTYAGIQGFIKYNLESNTASDVFNSYKTINKEVHSKIVAQTKVDFKIIQNAPFKTL